MQTVEQAGAGQTEGRSHEMGGAKTGKEKRRRENGWSRGGEGLTEVGLGLRRLGKIQKRKREDEEKPVIC